MRIYALYIVVAFLVVYAWKDWFKCLCALIVMMAFMEHEDMPKTMFGIQGFNMWNILFVGIFAAWLANRRRERLEWDMPRHINLLLLLYLAVIVIGFLRAVFDRSHIEHSTTTSSLVSEQLINTVKWVLPGLMLFDGCRSRKRVQWAVVSILGMYFLLAAQVVKRSPWSTVLASEGPGADRIRTNVCRDIGFGRCDMSTFLAGASWAMLAAVPLVRRKKHKLLILGAAGITAFGQALTGGRAGYAAWAATGLVLCIVKWRKALILAPLVPVAVMLLLPGVAERALYGFDKTDVSGQTITDAYEVTSGRDRIWPHVIEKIQESPGLGYGRLAVQRTGLQDDLRARYGKGEAVGQTHNMYLELLLDNGIIGSIPVLLFFGLTVVYSTRLFRAADPWCSVAGGLALSMVLAQLFAGMGSQHFYPEESKVGMWAGMFLMLRVHVERVRFCATVGNGRLHVNLGRIRPSGMAAVS